MAKIRIGERDAAGVGQLLRQISQDSQFPDDIRRSATRWNGVIGRAMDRRDLQGVTWLLRDASARNGAPAAEREAAGRWAAYLEGRIW